MTRNEMVKTLWRDLKTDPPPRDSNTGVLLWREEPNWAKGWGMRGWAYYYSCFAEYITYQKQFRRSMSPCLVDIARKLTHWMYLPLPYENRISIDLIAIQERLWINVDKRMPPKITQGGYVLCNPLGQFRVTVATGISAANIVHYSYVTERKRVRFWMPLVGPYDTI